MSKAILVIDMPNSCDECKIRFDDEYSNWCPYDNPEPNGVWQYVEKRTKPDWCPLQEIPKKKEYYLGCDEYEEGCVDGWNDCIEYLTE